ncbi:hypothetical protein M406DRAFT_70009 [Cryphonectria parasitica EP155]|uniref:Uncharacterized protein n=1 Tax=Cryphonectria parasitica (strain ATCC 38755 / EP155) TaxID=660469 RepID=A0A9P4Y7H2_CRYP1|nr:uncharacterized protein M406DRAFT_70009 [Cryphonectria parasitica EP155]KAF3767906.1 hypothetical protein M406DRAFT_70009 [Cryphonectria parasitica EP155]
MQSPSRIFHPALRVYQIWGTHQGVGKTVFSTILAWAAARSKRAKGARDHVGFLKPLTIGKLQASDNEVVQRAFFGLLQGKTLPTFFKSRTLFHQAKSVEDQSEHETALKDRSLLTGIREYVAAHADLDPPGGWMFLETLDDPECRLPSGNIQADVYSPLELPAILVGSSSGDGVDKTIKTYDDLRRRNYDVRAVAIFKDGTENHLRAEEYFKELQVRCLPLRPIPDHHPDERKDRNTMRDYWSAMARSHAIRDLLADLYVTHNQSVMKLEAANAAFVEAFKDGPLDTAPGIPANPHEKSVWERELKFSFAVPGKHRHKV